MSATLRNRALTTEGNDCAERFQPELTVERRGNSLSCACLTDAVDASGVIRKQLATEVGQSESQFSKSLSGMKGGDFNQVLDHIRPSIRLDYARRIAESEREGGLEDLAAERLALAAIQYLTTRRIPLRAAKARLKGERE